MKYFKKYPIFFAAMFALLALFAAGVAYDAMLLKKDKDALAKLNRSMRQYDESLSTDPTQPSIDASKKNIKELENTFSTSKRISPARASTYSSRLRRTRASSCAKFCAAW